MDRITNKLPALLFALVMAVSLLSMRTFAAETDTTLISSAAITLDAPEAGARPDYTAVFPSGAKNYSSKDGVSHGRLNDILWRDSTDDTLLDPDAGLFQAGHEYTVTVYLTA